MLYNGVKPDYAVAGKTLYRHPGYRLLPRGRKPWPKREWGAIDDIGLIEVSLMIVGPLLYIAMNLSR